jgi:hypothetical protein
MMGEENRHDALGRSRRLRTALIVSAVLAIVLLATACAGGSSGPGVAGSTSTPNAGASPSGTLREAQLDYARCMRDHGIADFPDPQPGGGTIRIKPGGQGATSTRTIPASGRPARRAARCCRLSLRRISPRRRHGQRC